MKPRETVWFFFSHTIFHLFSWDLCGFCFSQTSFPQKSGVLSLIWGSVWGVAEDSILTQIWVAISFPFKAKGQLFNHCLFPFGFRSGWFPMIDMDQSVFGKTVPLMAVITCYHMPVKVCLRGLCSVLTFGWSGKRAPCPGPLSLIPFFSSSFVHRCPQGGAGLHDPLHHLLCHLPRGLCVPALHHGEGKPLLPFRGHHAGVLWVC